MAQGPASQSDESNRQVKLNQAETLDYQVI